LAAKYKQQLEAAFGTDRAASVFDRLKSVREPLSADVEHASPVAGHSGHRAPGARRGLKHPVNLYNCKKKKEN